MASKIAASHYILPTHAWSSLPTKSRLSISCNSQAIHPAQDQPISAAIPVYILPLRTRSRTPIFIWDRNSHVEHVACAVLTAQPGGPGAALYSATNSAGECSKRQKQWQKERNWISGPRFVARCKPGLLTRGCYVTNTQSHHGCWLGNLTGCP